MQTNGANASYNVAGVSIATHPPQTKEKSGFIENKINLMISFWIIQLVSKGIIYAIRERKARGYLKMGNNPFHHCSYRRWVLYYWKNIFLLRLQRKVRGRKYCGQTRCFICNNWGLRTQDADLAPSVRYETTIPAEEAS